jgi:hypothetical protein
MLELVPYPIPPAQVRRLTGLVAAQIEKYGLKAVAEARLRQLSRNNDPTDVLGRLLRNTAIAFSEPQLSRLVRRELLEITGLSAEALEREVRRDGP